MTTIRDISTLAKVSPTTVSRVLNHHPGVSESTRESVLRAARELNYPLRHSPQMPINKTVIVLTRYMDEKRTLDKNITGLEFEQKVWSGINAVFKIERIPVRLQPTLFSVGEITGFLSEPSVSGLVLLGGVIPLDFVTALKDSHYPFVVVGSHMKPLQVNCVMADVTAGIEEAVFLLANKGRRRIGFINGPDTTKTSNEKLNGYKLGLIRSGLAYEPNLVLKSDFCYEGGYEFTKQLLTCYPALDAILYADDYIAIGGMKAIHESGRQIPNDVAIVGFGDFGLGEYAEIPLASIHYDVHEMGLIAARRLSWIIQQPDDQFWCILVPTRFVERESCG